MTLKEGIWLSQIPMPPSENNCYPTSRSGHRFESAELKEFKSRAQIWSLKRFKEIAQIIEELRWALADHRKCLHVQCWLHFQHDSLFTKAEKNARPRRKKLDPHNRLKALLDSLAAMLNIDDSRMSLGECTALVRAEEQGQFVTLRLSLSTIHTDKEMNIPPTTAI